ncbi:MAG TPA: hypothetical protein VM345_00610 [Acidimicrobiales bacterium]|nr:hypothetical protein [Acidimicrobiales bacterium]
MVLPRFRPMLASSGAIPGDADDYAFEPKLDGWRSLVYVEPDRLTVRTRTGRDVTDALVGLDGLRGACGGSRVILDGELVAHRGTPDSFYRLGARMAARSPLAKAARVPVTFVAFDVLFRDGELIRSSYVERRHVLESLHLQGPAWCTAPSFRGLGAELFAACVELGLEGLMAKRLDGRYRPGERSSTWIKAKTVEWKTRHLPYRGDR